MLMPQVLGVRTLGTEERCQTINTSLSQLLLLPFTPSVTTRAAKQGGRCVGSLSHDD